MLGDRLKLVLKKKPKNPIVIEGFPGFGLVGTITTEFLCEHLKCEKIGYAYFNELPATIAIHAGKVVDPVSIYYNKRKNILIIHSIAAAKGVEWKAADLVLEICKQTKAKHLVCIEGVGSAQQGKERAFYWSNDPAMDKKMKSAKIENLGEGIIVGVTSSLMVKTNLKTTSIFSEVHSKLPDSMAAARAIKVMDAVFNLGVNYRPLVKKAEQFEEKLQGLLKKAKATQKTKNKKTADYIG